jgi:hypothetical protein
VAELDEITQIRDRARKRHDDLRKTRLNEFMEGFGIITGKLKEMYQVNISSLFLSVSKRKPSATTDQFFLKNLRKTRLNEFMEDFGIITGKLKEIYRVNNRFFFHSILLFFLFFVFLILGQGMMWIGSHSITTLTRREKVVSQWKVHVW